MSARGIVRHRLKCLDPFFWDVKTGAKPFECRRADRDFRVGDVLELAQWVEGKGFTGDEIERRVTYVLTGEAFGIMPGFCVMGLGPC